MQPNKFRLLLFVKWKLDYVNFNRLILVFPFILITQICKKNKYNLFILIFNVSNVLDGLSSNPIFFLF